MANDGSLASKVEAWIVTTLEALTCFAGRDVEVFPGVSVRTGGELVKSMRSGHSSPYVCVLFEGDSAVRLEEGEQAYDPTYAIYVVVENVRPAAARMGDVVGETTINGTNGYRDLIRNALHDQTPAQTANGFYAEKTEFRGVRVIYQDADVFVMRAELVVREVPAAV